MATYTVYEEPHTGAGIASDDNGFASGTATRKFNIASDTAGISAAQVRIEATISGQLPRVGSQHPSIFGLTCKGVNVTQKSPIVFEATANYRSPSRPEDQEDEELPPWQQPAKVRWYSIKSSEETDEDADGNAIKNEGTGEPVTGIQRRITDMGISVQRNLLVWDPTEIFRYQDTTNNATFAGFGRGLVLMDDISANLLTHDGQTYYEASYVFIARKPLPHVPDQEAWYHRRTIKGFYELVSGEIRRAVDDDKNPVTSPVFLDDTGARIAASDPPEFASTKLYPEQNFNNLLLFQ